MQEDVTRNHELANGLARASAKLDALTKAGIAVRKITVINGEPAFMLGADEEMSAGRTSAPARRR
jgi:hypothetical protein